MSPRKRVGACSNDTETKLKIIFAFQINSICSSSFSDAPLSYRHLFQRDSGRRLSARPARQYHESTIEACASACVMETSFLCKSFDLDNTLRSCELFSVSLDDPDVQLIAADDIDHYRSKQAS